MAIRPLHNPEQGPLKMIALMSGSGTNVRRILEHREKIKPEEGGPIFEIAVIFSDCFDSKAAQIGRDYDIPVITHDLAGWLKKNNVPRRDFEKREEFDRQNVRALKAFQADMAIYGGYMAIASPTLIKAFVGVNVHPADLSIQTPDGKRRFTGAHAVRDAIRAGEKTIRASTHLVTQEVDMGPLLMISEPVEVMIPTGADLDDAATLEKVTAANQDRLKQAGDWVIFPRTIEAIARGWFGRDEKGAVYYREKPAPDGLRL